MSLETKPPFNALAYAAAGVSVTRRANGEVILQSTHALPAFPRCVGDWLDYWAECAPERVFMAERRAAEWRTVTYAQALIAVRSLGCALFPAASRSAVR